MVWMPVSQNYSTQSETVEVKRFLQVEEIFRFRPVTSVDQKSVFSLTNDVSVGAL